MDSDKLKLTETSLCLGEFRCEYADKLCGGECKAIDVVVINTVDNS